MWNFQVGNDNERQFLWLLEDGPHEHPQLTGNIFGYGIHHFPRESMGLPCNDQYCRQIKANEILASLYCMKELISLTGQMQHLQTESQDFTVSKGQGVKSYVESKF